jgi:general secretion pathway protein G
METIGQNMSPRVGERGFTLIELIVVIVILGLLASIVGTKVYRNVAKGKTATARSQIELLKLALEELRIDTGDYPSTAQGLGALVANPGMEHWDGPYLQKQTVPPDPWGNPYVYQSPGAHAEYDLSSLGKDGASGGDGESADIASWE